MEIKLYIVDKFPKKWSMMPITSSNVYFPELNKTLINVICNIIIFKTFLFFHKYIHSLMMIAHLQAWAFFVLTMVYIFYCRKKRNGRQYHHTIFSKGVKTWYWDKQQLYIIPSIRYFLRESRLNQQLFVISSIIFFYEIQDLKESSN